MLCGLTEVSHVSEKVLLPFLKSVQSKASYLSSIIRSDGINEDV